MESKEKGWKTGQKGESLKEQHRAKVYKIVEDVAWKTHPVFEKIRMKVLLSQKDDQTDCTVFIGNTPKGEMVPEHIHENSDDLLYPLSGKAKLWIEGLGDFELRKGVIARVPKGVLHKVYNVSEDFYALDVFVPAVL
jgi:quercetin dioxygenase-like cupin family protein